MKIATYNVNSLRKRMPVVLDWLAKNRPDVMCLQETKVQDADFPLKPLEDAGYHVAFRGMKAYNGVATLTLHKPEHVSAGLKPGPEADEFRLLRVDVDGVAIVNTYIPQGHAVPSEKFSYKLRWYADLLAYFRRELDKEKPAVWLGDVNVAPEPIDVHNADKQLNDPCYHEDARRAYKAAKDWGFEDVFRRLHPDRMQYTFWDYFRGNFEGNRGWRIDHILATPPMARLCVAADVDTGPRRAAEPSDHTVMWAEFKLPS